MNSSKRLTLALVAALLIWGVGVGSAQASDDTWITTKVRIALMTTDGAGRNAVKVDTEHGKVTLHGTVDSEAVKEKAEATARTVGGVTDVRNLLQVVKESSQKSVKAADKDVKEGGREVAEEGQEPRGHQGEVGRQRPRVPRWKHTASLDHKLPAIEVAYDIPGVRQVTTDIETKEK